MASSVSACSAELALRAIAGEPVQFFIDQLVYIQARAAEMLAVTRRLLPRDTDLRDTRRSRHRLHPLDQGADLAPALLEWNQEVGAEGDEQITVDRTLDHAGATKHTERLDDKPEPEPLVAGKRQQRAGLGLGGVGRRAPVAVDRPPLGQRLV